MSSIEHLAILMHDAWRQEKISMKHWHIPENCPERKKIPTHENPTRSKCDNCHTCVGPWQTLKKEEKKQAIDNSKIAHKYFRMYIKQFNKKKI